MNDERKTLAPVLKTKSGQEIIEFLDHRFNVTTLHAPLDYYGCVKLRPAMLLSRDHVAALVNHLHSWLNTGSFKLPPLDNSMDTTDHTLQPHQNRVIVEKADLDDKINKLVVFIGGEVFRKLDSIERSRLNRQLEAMSLYSHVLGERIAAFQK